MALKILYLQLLKLIINISSPIKKIGFKILTFNRIKQKEPFLFTGGLLLFLFALLFRL